MFHIWVRHLSLVKRESNSKTSGGGSWQTTNEIYLFQTTPLTGHAPHSGSHVHAVGGVAKQDQVQRGKRGANVTLDILTEQDGGAQWTEKSRCLGDKSYK